MSIRPIDIQVTIQKVDQHIKDSNTNARVAVQQQGAASELQKQVMRSQKQVISTSGSRHKKVERDSQRDTPQYSGKQHNKKRQNQDKGNTIDIIV